MIFLSDAAGVITAAIPEAINQGSIGVNRIVLIAPFPSNAVVSATFTLPNGIKIYPRYVGETPEDDYAYLMGVVEAFGNKGLTIDGVTVNVWQLTLDKAITQVAGKVTVQFLVTTAVGTTVQGDGDITISDIVPGSAATLTTTSATLPINRGNAYISPSVEPTQFELIQQYLAAANNAANAAEGFVNDAEGFASEAEGWYENAKDEADRAKEQADRYSPWDLVITQDNVLAVLNTLAAAPYKSILFFGVDFTSLNLERFIVNGRATFNFPATAEKVEFRGCQIGNVPLVLVGNEGCNIIGASDRLLKISTFGSVSNCTASEILDCDHVSNCTSTFINDCNNVTGCTATQMNNCAKVSASKANAFTGCTYVDPYSVEGRVAVGSEAVGQATVLTENGTYVTAPLASRLVLSVNSANYKVSAILYDRTNAIMSTSMIDLPLESVVVGATVSEDGTKLILTLQNGTTVDVPIGDIFRGVATEKYVNDTVGQAIDNLPPYDVATEEVDLGFQQAYLKLTIDNLLDGDYTSFQPFDMVCVGNDEYPLSSICTVTVESYDLVKMLVYNTGGMAETLCPKYYTSEDGNVYLYFSIDSNKHFQVFIRGLVEKCTGATLEIVDALPDDIRDIGIEKHLNEDYVSYYANGVTQRRPIGETPKAHGIVCRNEGKGIEVRSLNSGETYADNEVVPLSYIRDTMLPNAGGGKLYRHTFKAKIVNSAGDVIEFWCKLYRTISERITTLVPEELASINIFQLIVGGNFRSCIGMDISSSILQIRYINTIEVSTGAVTFASVYFNVAVAELNNYVIKEV